MKTPLILVNFKTYETGTGDHALRIAKLCEEVANETGVSIAIAVQPTDLRMIAEAVQIPVFAQHVDGISFGSNTGHILPHAIKQAGASGTLLNHSEDRYSDENLTAAMKACKDNGIFVIACAPTAADAARIAAMGPDMVAVEPPELIGGDISISTGRPGLITETVEAVRKVTQDVPVLCGAGVSTTQDVRTSLQLGAKGVLLASGVMKADDPAAVLTDLVEGTR